MPEDSPAVEEAMSQIPELSQSTEPDDAAATPPEEEEGLLQAPDQPVPDSEAVQAALDQIPGLKESLGD
jgi:hypothetical protein